MSEPVTTDATAGKTVARNHTRKITAIKKAAVRAICFSERSKFEGVDIDPEIAWEELYKHDHARLIEKVPGQSWTITIHDNRWFELHAAEPEQPDEQDIPTATSSGPAGSNVVNDAVDGPVIVLKGANLQVGDRLMFLGREHIIDHLTPYGPTNMPDIVTPDTRIAKSGPTWSMTIFAGGLYRIRPRVAAPMQPQPQPQHQASDTPGPIGLAHARRIADDLSTDTRRVILNAVHNDNDHDTTLYLDTADVTPTITDALLAARLIEPDRVRVHGAHTYRLSELGTQVYHVLAEPDFAEAQFGGNDGEPEPQQQNADTLAPVPVSETDLHTPRCIEMGWWVLETGEGCGDTDPEQQRNAADEMFKRAQTRTAQVDCTLWPEWVGGVVVGYRFTCHLDGCLVSTYHELFDTLDEAVTRAGDHWTGHQQEHDVPSAAAPTTPHRTD